MSRENITRQTRNFWKGWDRAKSQAAGDMAYSDYDQPHTETEIDINPEVGSRNRSGERRRTGKKLTDVT